MASFLDRVKGLTQKKGGKDKEIEKYEKILSGQPEDRNALNALGDLYAKRGEAGKASEYYLQVGSLYAKDGFTLKAIAVYKKAQRAKSDFVQTYLVLAELYVQKGLIGEAKTNYLHAAEMQATAGAKHESLDTYHKIADLDPDNVNIRIKLAAMYENEKFFEEASAIYIEIGKVLAQDDFKEGKTYFQKALDLQPESEQILSEIGYAYIDLDMRQEAVEIFGQLHDLYPDNIDYREQVDELSEAPATPQKAPPVVQEAETAPAGEISIDFSEDELSALNFGDEPAPDAQMPQDNVIELPVSEVNQPAVGDHSLDFQIEDQGAISWESETPAQDSSSQNDHSLDFSMGEPAEQPAAVAPVGGDSQSGEFFDLADKLEMAAQPQQAIGVEPPSSLKVEAPEELATSDVGDIVKEFKQGVMEEVGTEDYETHYELGISYKEMDLLDDAIEELKLASVEPAIFVDCQSVIAMCYHEKGEYGHAVQALQEARAKVKKGSEKYQDIIYQIGSTYETQDNAYEAVQIYQELFQINSNYRDVKQKLKKLLG